MTDAQTEVLDRLTRNGLLRGSVTIEGATGNVSIFDPVANKRRTIYPDGTSTWGPSRTRPCSSCGGSGEDAPVKVTPGAPNVRRVLDLPSLQGEGQRGGGDREGRGG